LAREFRELLRQPPMPHPRYLPCDFLVDRTMFGKKSARTWVPEPADDPERLRHWDAARLQHRWVVAVKNEIRLLGLTNEKYAERTGYSLDRTERLFRGVVIARLEDFAAASRVLGLNIDLHSKRTDY
jgi:hypothetical protein